jgi:hypothetical protein
MSDTAPSSADYKRVSRHEARDIGPCPAVVDPARKARCALDLLAFLQSYLAHRFPLAFSPDHLALIASIQGIILHGGQRALAMPRGSGKTTITEAAALWAILYGHARFLVVVAASGELSDQIAESIRAELEFCDLLAEDFPEVCHPIRALGGISRRAEGQTSEDQLTHLVWTRDEVRLPSAAAGGGSVVRSASITGQIRGAKAVLADGSQIRPDLVLVDDPQTDESARSASQVATRLRTIKGTILGLSGPGKKISCLCACTIIARGDVADQLLNRESHPEWQGSTAKLLQSLPTEKAMAAWDKYAEIYHEDLRNDAIPQGEKIDRATAYYLKHRAKMDAGAVASWPERVAEGEASAIQHGMTLRITRGAEAFAAEYQNAPQDLAAGADLAQLDAEQIACRLNRRKPGLAPSSAVELTAGIDLGEHVLWWSVVAWGGGFAGDVVAYGPYPQMGRTYITAAECKGALAKAHPTGSTRATWRAALDTLCGQILDRDWQTEDGGTMRVSRCLIDAGYGESTDTVYEFCRASAFRDRVLPSHGRGIGAKHMPMADWPKKPGDKMGTNWRISKPKNRNAKAVFVDTNAWKSFLAARLLAPIGGAGCLLLPGDKATDHRMLADHLAAERRVRVSANGRTLDEWTWIPGRDNHLLDTVVLAACAASIEGVRLDGEVSRTTRAMARNRTAPASPAVTGQPHASPAKSAAVTRRRSVRIGPDGYAVSVYT